MTINRGWRAREIEALAIRMTTLFALSAAPGAIAVSTVAWLMHWPVIEISLVSWPAAAASAGMAVLVRSALISSAIARNFFDATSDIQLDFRVDARGVHRLAGWNHAAETFGRLRLKIGAPAAEVYADMPAHGNDPAGREALQSGVPISIMAAFDFDGEQRIFDTIYMPVKPDGKRIQRVLLSARDVTEARMAEASALESGRVLEALSTVAQVGVWRYATADRMIDMSASARAIFGLPDKPNPMPVHDVVSRIHPDDVEQVMAEQSSAVAKGEDFYLPYRLLRPDGEVRHVVARGRAHPPVDGVTQIMDGVTIDVTELKLADEALKASEASYRRLAQSMTDLVLSIGADTKITFTNEACFNILGYRPEELIGMTVFDLLHPEDRERILAIHEEWMAAGGTGAFPTIRQRTRRKDGSYVWMESRPSTIVDPVTGAFIATQDTARDITAQVELEAQLDAARRDAEAGAQAKAEFLANMSHELRTPLTSIIGFAELLSRADGLDEEPRRYSKRVHDASRALLDIINDVLDFSKLDAGQVELDRQPFSVRDFVDETAGLVALQAERKGVELVVEMDETLPDQVSGDRAKLRQVMLNLLGNAVKFTSEGSVRVSATYRTDCVPARLVVTIADTGPGIPADRVGQLFQRFTQADSSISRDFGGTGLGLAICRGMVELMGGEVGVESRFGEGSTFHFEVPAEAATALNDVHAAANATQELRAARILLVDDTDVNRELVRALLSPFEFDIEEAANGQEAVDAARARDFDLILMDVRMPGMDGLAATRAIRAAAKPGPRTPILAMSADILPANIRACVEAGMDDHVAKPIAVDELIGKIAAWLNAGAAESDQRASA